MRVGLVCPYSLTLPGGVQEQVLGLARTLRAMGHQARVLGPSDGPPPDVGVIPLGNCLPTQANGSVAPIAPDPSCALRMIRALRDEEFDVLHLHEPCAPGPTVTALVQAPAPLVGTFHAAGVSAAYRWLRPLTRWLASRLTVRCAVSEDARALASRYLGGTYTLLFNGIEVDRFAKASPWPSPGRTVLFLSRHEARKGLDVLLAAMVSVPGARLLVAGPGDPSDVEVPDSVADRVTFLGLVSEEDKARFFHSVDVYVAPNTGGESFGIVLIEAMAAGAPVVASDLDAFRRVLDDGDAGEMFETGNPSALAAALNDLLADPARRRAMAKRASAVVRRYDWPAIADAIVGVYETVLA